MPSDPTPHRRDRERTDALWDRITDVTRTSTEALQRTLAVETHHSTLQARVLAMEESLQALTHTVDERFDALDAAVKGDVTSVLADVEKRVRNFEGYVIQFNGIDDHRRDHLQRIEDTIATLSQRLDGDKADGAAEKSRQEARMNAIESDVGTIKNKIATIDAAVAAVPQLLEEHNAARRLTDEERRREAVANALRQERIRLTVSTLTSALSRLILVLVTATVTLFVSTNPATPNPVRGPLILFDVVLALVVGALTLWTIVHQRSVRAGQVREDRSHDVP